MDLPAGDYYVLIQIDDDEHMMPFTLLNNNIFEEVTIIPNVITTGFADIFYELKTLPSYPLKIKITDYFGNELSEVYNAIPSTLSAQIPINLIHFIAGFYFVVFEVEDAIYITPPFILSIIKH